MAGGRPSKFKPEYVEQVEKLCKLGATDEQLACFFEVSVSTINLWKQRHPEFSEPLKRGKLIADAAVAHSLFKRATGYSHPAVKIFNDQGQPLIVDYTQHHPPDTTAAIFWLKNRQPQFWRDKVEQVQTGPNGGPVQQEVTYRYVVVDPKSR
ncbi:helix-turn-helix domain-containing protein [Microvirga arabica]|uniref:Helix-turn-helix domain-containing protein n=1 Tax=Microvirga arabica TaxID=1128671 RepID=A0ABV6YES4_9HYPH